MGTFDLVECDHCGLLIDVPSDHEVFCPLKGTYNDPPTAMGEK